MGDLIRRQDAIDALVETEDIKGLAYKQLEDRLQKIPAVAIERDCDRCFGACFGDCSDCEPVIVRSQIEALSADRPKKVVAQVTFDEEKLREIVKEAVKRFKEEYEIVDRPQGEWLDYEMPLEDGGAMPIQVCSLCKTFYPLAYTGGGHRFCPNCGARMKGADDTPQKTMCRDCDDYAGDGMYCASNFLVYDFSTSRENCETERNE